MAPQLVDFLVLLVALTHIAISPFTKVEESFNLQATHDILVYTTDIPQYDHNEFPGVVPRTFLGALAIGAISSPMYSVVEILGLPRYYCLFVVRASLALLVWMSLTKFTDALRSKYGRDTGVCFALITCSQFHLPFYMSRTLPNTFALALAIMAARAVVLEKWYRVVAWLTVAMVLFRCDIAVLLAPVGLTALITRKLPVVSGLAWGALCATLCIGVTVVVDSLFWGYWLWPEASVFYFNTFLNKSHEWGVMPWHWYFTSALPRSLLLSVALIPFALFPPLAYLRVFKLFGSGKGDAPSTATPLAGWVDQRLMPLFLPWLCFVLLYSALPHKELRFIFPVIPVMNAVAAVGMARIYRGARRRPILMLGACAALLLSCCLTAVFTAASSMNYPGGVALQKLHELESNAAYEARCCDLPPNAAIPNDCSSTAPIVHIDVASAMTGVSRFLQKRCGWRYSKDEAVTDYSAFDYLLTAAPAKHTALFRTIQEVPSFHRIDFRRFQLLTKPTLYIMARKQVVDDQGQDSTSHA